MTKEVVRYKVGDKVFHELFGEGLVVEVRSRPFFDILEVAFGDTVRKVTSIHPQLRVPGTDGKAETADAVVPAEKESKSEKKKTTKNTAVAKVKEPFFEFASREFVDLDEESLEWVLDLKKQEVTSQRCFVLHHQGERLALSKGFDTLLALGASKDVDHYDYQIKACLRVLRHMKGRALLADEVGLGKTVETGLVLKELVLRGLVRRALVLVPVSLLTQWRQELEHKFDLPFRIFSRGDNWGDHPFLLASLDTAKGARNRNAIREQNFDLLVVDEAHRLRNHLTQAWKFIESLSLKYVLLVTATPVQNDLRELYNLVTLLRPGTLGTYRAFRKKFMVRGDKRLPKNTRELSRLLSDVMIRTTRSQTNLTFPKREILSVPLELSREEKLLYEGVSDFIYDLATDSEDDDFRRWHFFLIVLQKEIGSSTAAAAGTLRLVQRAKRLPQHQRRISELAELAESVKIHNKFEKLWEIIEDQLIKKKEKILLFTQFRRTLHFIEKELKERGVNPAIFHGGLSPKNKDAAVESFKGKAPILLSTESGGEGRNLQFANIVVNYDLPWNPMRLEQRIGRVHRLGQKKDVTVYNLAAQDTVESHVLWILHRKVNMFELVIGEMEMVLGHWDHEQAFENRVFEIWAHTREQKEREIAFDRLGDELIMAQKRYEHVRNCDEEIFDMQRGELIERSTQ
ncbi:MAG: DEAD/DEAH box helicase [Candidatus Eisenbacteria bacterium]|uniref:DEAD/DEAH box helicase n=1 Tax=Eiseniibacteriota bacterium TaxID=2212470 RepID=A0A948RY36_UNCEI|nr:DEAD/DEAH box helicase [Candidatus Eisenbacteria bacterium]MBU2691693.1 DEAD/DEAH box helicase [Candidatus Eisenbacteria bacterium]